MRVVLAPEAIWREVDGDVIVVGPQDPRVLTLNGTGAWLWRRLAAPAELSAHAEALAARHGLPLARAEADVTAFVDDLVAQGLAVLVI
jgi:hypothetical protein